MKKLTYFCISPFVWMASYQAQEESLECVLETKKRKQETWVTLILQLLLGSLLAIRQKMRSLSGRLAPCRFLLVSEVASRDFYLTYFLSEKWLPFNFF